VYGLRATEPLRPTWSRFRLLDSVESVVHTREVSGSQITESPDGATISATSLIEPRAPVRPRAPALGISRVAWAPPGLYMSRDQWVVTGRRLGSISRCNQWWLGDWAGYGTARWGEKYSAAARITGYDPRSLANMAWIAAAFPRSRRRDNLTWSHHATLAALPAQEQDRWLDLATAQRLSVADLRVELRAARSGARSSHATRRGGAVKVTCPKCQHLFAFDAGHCSGGARQRDGEPVSS
jgi:hypothetical protein